MSRTRLTASERRRVNAAARHVGGIVGKGGGAAPAKRSGGTLKQNALGLVAALAFLVVFFGFVMPSDRFGELIDSPRGKAALLGAGLAAVIGLVLTRKAGAKGTGGLVLTLALAAGVGYGLWRVDAGSAAVDAGLMRCPPATSTAAWATAPDGSRCVKVPRCPRGKTPGWQADKATPTGTCVARKATR